MVLPVNQILATDMAPDDPKLPLGAITDILEEQMIPAGSKARYATNKEVRQSLPLTFQHIIPYN